MRLLLILLLGISLSLKGADKLHLINPGVYTGTSDASGAVAVGTNLFILADDENNVLRVYRSDQPGPPIKGFDMDDFLELRGKSHEADLEAGARIGDRAFWIGSHGRNANGKARPNRGCFFATDIKTNGTDVTLVPVGRPFKSLLDYMIADPRFERFHLAEAAQRAPKAAGGVSIEGLSATPDGHLLIGFRNPIPDKKSLIVPLLNPNDVVTGKPPQFGDPIQLDLGGLGIRDMAFYSGTYVIIAGPYHGGSDFRIYQWQGPGTEPKSFTVRHLQKYHPEAIIIYPQKGLEEIQILSDDGTLENEGAINKKIADVRHRTFRSFWLSTKKVDALER